VVNGAMATDALVVAVPAGVRLEQPLHVVNVCSEAAAGGGEAVLRASAPRLLVALGAGADAEVVEEFVSAAAGAGRHAVFAVAEVVLEPGASLRHGYVQREAPGSVHFKATLVDQAEGSSYSLVEARVGGALSRHDVGVAQCGPDTSTRMRHFLLAGANQLQDLHTKLVLDHPRGEADQLHKCIVSHATGRGVFDGNVKARAPERQGGSGRGAWGTRWGLASPCAFMLCASHRVSSGRGTPLALSCGTALLANAHSRSPAVHPPFGTHCFPCPLPQQVNRMAQKTDAGQLSRNLLLMPRATVNVKPNLQIIADDVKCTHGAAISDLSEEELFYFRWG
jgi:Fe-S cluster assembly scaffold protein SufB